MYPDKKEVDLTEINAECAAVLKEYQKMKEEGHPSTAEIYTAYKYLCAKRALMMK